MRVVGRLLFAGLLLTAVGHAAAQTTRPENPALRPYVAPTAPYAAQWPRDRLVHFMRELADFVHTHHTVKDPDRLVYGMIYEFWRDGEPMQAFSLDSMHDGAWFASALATAHRVDPDGPYLERLQQFHVPFYVNVIRNSDRLFAEGQRRSSEKILQPLKGWVPRGWDDGVGVDKVSGKRFDEDFAHAHSPETTIARYAGRFHYVYFTPSNQLAQTLSDSLLNVWLTTHDPAIAQAATDLHRYRRSYFGSIPPLEFASAVTAEDAAALAKQKPAEFQPSVMNPYYTGMYELRGHALPSHDDGLAWAYRRAMTLAALHGGDISSGFAASGLARVYGDAVAMECYSDDRPYRYGVYLFELQTMPRFLEEQGRLDVYASRGRKLLGGRGIELSWVVAGLLPALKRNPALWESYHVSRYPTELLVRVVDAPPVTDGRRDAAYDRQRSLGDDSARVTLLSDPKNLHLLVESDRPTVSVAIKHAVAPAGALREGRFTLWREGKVVAVNHLGEELLCAAAFSRNGRWTAELRIPYSVVPGQRAWINGVEHGRYVLTINGGKPQVIYMLSDASRMLRRLEQMALGTIQTWYDVWQNQGIIPSALSGPNAPANSWGISDSGNYAHLIMHIALWIMYQDGTSEWDLARALAPAQPRPARPLPASVLRAQLLVSSADVAASQ